MKKNDDLLSPEYSPQKLQTSGVKRVNNIPLIIAISILTIFVVLIALVANKRANAQNQLPEIATSKNQKKNTMSMAYEVVENQHGVVIPVQKESTPIIQNPTPPILLEQMPQLNNKLLEQTVPDAELERIRQEKTQAFEEAVNAKTAIMIDNTHFNNHDIQRGAVTSQASGSNIDNSAFFKDQLQLLQSGLTKPMPQTLGGEENEMRWHLNSRLQNPNSRFELRAGSVIPGVMISGISSDLPGQVIGQVSQNVYDTATGKYLLIPQGTKILGLYSSEVGFGQNSVLVAWQRLVFPDGKALDIGSMPGADSAGFSGFRDKANQHYTRIYGSALLMSGIIGGITYSQNINQSNPYGYGQPDAGSVLSQALGQQLGEVTSQLISKNLTVSPTITIRQGYRFNIVVVKDLPFKSPYRQFA